jgi:hypothetical protein
MDRVLNCQNYRRFGVEIELNTLDGHIRKLDRHNGEIPLGSDNIALIIKNTINKNVEIQGWDHNFNNDNWIVKPDSSCGIEVCSPVLKGWSGLIELIKVIEKFKERGIKADQRCSLHVHINISDLNLQQLASVIAWYIKCEHIFMESVPSCRKINRYCQMLGMTDLFQVESPIVPEHLLNSISNVKYYSLNAYHFVKGGGFSPHNNRKKTIEFRIGENAMCLDGLAVKNWIRLLLHFVEVTKSRPLPYEYKKGDSWSGLLWLDVVDVFKVLNFDEPCSEGLNQVKNWFIERLLQNGHDTGLTGVWSNEARSIVRKDINTIVKNIDNNKHDMETMETRLYGKKYIK